MAIIKPHVSEIAPQKFIVDKQLSNLTLQKNLQFMTSSFELLSGETIFIENINQDHETALFLWLGDTLLTNGKDKIKYQNNETNSIEVQLITKGFDSNDENGGILPLGEYRLWQSPDNFADGSTEITNGIVEDLIVEYTFGKSGTYFIRQNPRLKDEGQQVILPKYSLDGVMFVELVPDVNGEFEITVSNGDKLIIKSNKDSLWKVTGEQTLSLAADNSNTSLDPFHNGTILSSTSSTSTSFTTTTTTSTYLTSSTSTTTGGEVVTRQTPTTTTNTNQISIGKTYSYKNRSRDGIVSIKVLNWGLTTTIRSHFAFYTQLTNFSIDASAGDNVIEDFSYAWLNCESLTSFPTLDASNATSLTGTWKNCYGLPHCPANNEVIIPVNIIDTYNMCDGVSE